MNAKMYIQLQKAINSIPIVFASISWLVKMSSHVTVFQLLHPSLLTIILFPTVHIFDENDSLI